VEKSNQEEKMKHLNETNSIVGSWILWLSGLAAQALPLFQLFSFASAGILSTIGIYIAIKKHFGRGKSKGN
jgi:hypothetical protein